MTEIELIEINEHGESVNTFDLTSPFILNAVVCGENEGEGPILDLLSVTEDSSIENIDAIAKRLLQTLDSDPAKYKSFVIAEFIADGTGDEQEAIFADLVDSLRQLADFLAAAVASNHRIKPSFSF